MPSFVAAIINSVTKLRLLVMSSFVAAIINSVTRLDSGLSPHTSVSRPAASTPTCRIILLNMIETCLCLTYQDLSYCVDVYDDFFVSINLTVMSMSIM
jgi:hypothetical protein